MINFVSDSGSKSSLHDKQFCYDSGMLIPLIIKGSHAVSKAGIVRKVLETLLDVYIIPVSMGGVESPKYLDGQNSYGANYKESEYAFEANDSCANILDIIRTVTSINYMYIRNYFSNRPILQASYRDNKPIVKDLKKTYKAGDLTPYQAKHWFGVQPEKGL